MAIIQSWERTVDYAYVELFRVVVGGGRGHFDSAGECSHAEFLNGRFNDIVTLSLGTRALQEMRTLLQTIETHDAYQTLMEEHGQWLASWSEIPLVPSLVSMVNSADFSVRYWPEEPVRLSSGSAVVIGEDERLYLNDPNGSRLCLGEEVGVRGEMTFNHFRADPVVVCGNTIFLAGWQCIHVLNGRGQPVRKSRDIGHALGIGHRVRVQSIHRHGSRIIFEYQCSISSSDTEALRLVGRRGYLEVSEHATVVGRSPA